MTEQRLESATAVERPIPDQLVTPGARVLAVGSADGPLASELRACGCEVVAVEPTGAAAVEERFDAALLEGVLELVPEPEALLADLRAALPEHAPVVASVRNVAHASIRLALLAGDFPVGGEAIRFFTRDRLLDLFDRAGYVVTAWRRERRELELGALAPDLAERLAADREAMTHSFVVRAVPAGEPARIHELRDELERVRSESAERDARLREAEHRLADALAEVDRLRGTPGTVAELEAMAAREDELRQLLLDAHEQLLRRDEEIQRLSTGKVQAGTTVLRRRIATRFPHLAGVYRAARARVRRPG